MFYKCPVCNRTYSTATEVAKCIFDDEAKRHFTESEAEKKNRIMEIKASQTKRKIKELFKETLELVNEYNSIVTDYKFAQPLIQIELKENEFKEKDSNKTSAKKFTKDLSDEIVKRIFSFEGMDVSDVQREVWVAFTENLAEFKKKKPRFLIDDALPKEETDRFIELFFGSFVSGSELKEMQDMVYEKYNKEMSQNKDTINEFREYFSSESDFLGYVSILEAFYEREITKANI